MTGKPHPVGIGRLRLSALAFGAVVFWISIQISPLVPAAMTHPIWRMAQVALARSLDATISVDPSETRIALIRLSTNASLFWLALQLSRNAVRADLLLQAIGLIVTAYAAYGLLSSAFFLGATPLLGPFENDLFVHATFVNRNNFATYAGLGLVVSLGLVLRLFRNELPGAAEFPRRRAATFLEAICQRGWLALGGGIVTLAALLGSGSRGGVLATALGALTLLALSFSSRGRIEAIVFVAASLIGGFVFLGDFFVGRIRAAGFEDGSRIPVHLITLRSIFDAPLTGFGYGTFADVFPMYRDRSIAVTGVWDKAHNTYLETLQGLGLIFGGASIVSLGAIVVTCFKGAIERRANAAPPTIASAASILVATHALVDFSFQIEAVTLTYLAILAIGCAQSESSQRSMSD